VKHRLGNQVEKSLREVAEFPPAVPNKEVLGKQPDVPLLVFLRHPLLPTSGHQLVAFRVSAASRHVVLVGQANEVQVVARDGLHRCNPVVFEKRLQSELEEARVDSLHVIGTEGFPNKDLVDATTEGDVQGGVPNNS